MAGELIPIRSANGQEVLLTPHAWAQFRERARLIYTGGDLDSEVLALDLLRRKAKRAGIKQQRPGWLHRTRSLTHQLVTHGYLTLDRTVAFPIEVNDGRLIATTCLVRGWDPPSGGRP